jgi:transcriptional regulator GlxA family with amidase domain
MDFAYVLYPNIEPIDLAAIGVLSMGKRVIPEINYFLVSDTMDPCTFANGLKVLPDFTFANSPKADYIIVPGGPGWPAASKNQTLLDYLKESIDSKIFSLCTGAMILAESGLLKNHTVTTKNQVVPPEISPLTILSEKYENINAIPALIVDSGRILTGGGVSLCIDTVLYVLEKNFGKQKVSEISRIMEYSHARIANQASFSTVII